MNVKEKLKTKIQDKKNKKRDDYLLEAQTNLVNSIKGQIDRISKIPVKLDESVTNQLQTHLPEIKKAVEETGKIIKAKKAPSQPELKKLLSIDAQLGEIIKIIVPLGAEPNEVIYQRDRENRIIRITERFDTFRLEHEWIYTRDNLSQIITTKHAIT